MRLIDEDATEAYLLDGRYIIEPVKKGKWTRKESKRMYWYVCSECGGGCPCNGYGQDMFTEWCPNCGAKMENT